MSSPSGRSRSHRYAIIFSCLRVRSSDYSSPIPTWSRGLRREPPSPFRIPRPSTRQARRAIPTIRFVRRERSRNEPTPPAGRWGSLADGSAPARGCRNPLPTNGAGGGGRLFFWSLHFSPSCLLSDGTRGKRGLSASIRFGSVGLVRMCRLIGKEKFKLFVLHHLRQEILLKLLLSSVHQ